MCGLTGFWHFNQITAENLQPTALRMASSLASRGPDSVGAWQDADLPFVMAHRRLAIRDLSQSGHQPMVSQCGRWIIAYNGEIYNAKQIVAELGTTVCLTGHSDTEVLLCALVHWGIKKTLAKLNGMFAFALWDSHQKKLYLARDRLGIKPLYYGFNRKVFFFGSQLKSFAQHKAWQPQIDFDALGSFLRMNYIMAPMTIYRDLFKLRPGHYLVFSAEGECFEEKYWSLPTSVSVGFSDVDLVNRLHDLLQDSVTQRMVADVPLGAFLSGGIDSSLVVALMQAQSTQKIKTFSIGFDEQQYNEAHFAAAVAQHLGTEHHELYLSDNQTMDLIPSLPQWYDEPFADSSQLPTLLVSKLAKSSVTVSLSGDGGDELFAGYPRYLLAQSMYKRLAILPLPLRKLLSKSLMSVKPAWWDAIAKWVPEKKRIKQLGDKVHKAAQLIGKDGLDFYGSLISLWPDEQALLNETIKRPVWPELQADGLIRKMQLLDTLTYLPDDILTKLDRASMAVSLEARVPLLDHRVVEFAFQLPQALLIRKNKGKWILRQILQRYVPQALVERPKMGFGVPIGHWLRGSLRDWAESLLSEHALNDAGLKAQPVRKCWADHLSGARNFQYALWGVLMYQAWRKAL